MIDHKDKTGRQIQVGDRIAYASTCRRLPALQIAVVIGLMADNELSLCRELDQWGTRILPSDLYVRRYSVIRSTDRCVVLGGDS